ncbi:sensor domain-containing diguanylate cyclase [Sphingomonas sp. BK580]|uniref:sensor domain-containing diguanylate cyclase n=1 Tax=Sphingomonas sp. BK580 TaxID=2586972 RepID=UPI00160FC52C|nr:sensor domain-containing diguanylate cyclase [Sphingomonas sp. BK580]MBB3693175.1 diguanylate cyclase (GGDEF)-like protein [Sphingomonas sp. BK580]
MSHLAHIDREDARLAALRALELLDTPPEAEFDAIVAGAQHLFDCKIAYVALIDANRQWFKASCGLDASETSREVSFCTLTIANDDLLVIPDTHADERFAHNPLVVGPPHVRFYAGVPLRVKDPTCEALLPIGTICVADDRPHSPAADKLAVLTGMARVVEALIDARRLSRDSLRLVLERQDALDEMARTQRLLTHAERMARIGSWRLEIPTGHVHWSEQTYAIHALEPHLDEPLAEALSFYSKPDRALLNDAIERCARDGTPWDLELDLTDARGVVRRVRTLGEIDRRGGERVAIMGVIQDITERHHFERHLLAAARTDELTGLPSRRAFNLEVEQLLNTAGDSPPLPFALAIIDLDRFKEVNDRLGHAAGDDVLQRMAGKLQGADYLGANFVARVGGDEFVVLMMGGDTSDRLPGCLSRLLADLRLEVTDRGDIIQVSATIGACLCDEELRNRSALLKAADDALYRAKARQRGVAAIAGREEVIRRDPHSC